MQQLPLFIGLFFGLTTLATIFLFCKATSHFKTTFFILTGWILFQMFIARTGFYAVTDALPPRLLLAIVPPFLLITGLFATRAGRNYLDTLDVRWLTLLHIIRVPVELVLFWLYLYKTIPEVMTFEGRNWDILSGITAPLVFYIGFVKKQLNRKALLLWNVVCFGLLVNIVSIAMLSAPFPFQQLAFEQPNIAVFHFPFVWLPSCVVPLVALSHLATIRQLVYRNAIVRKTYQAEEDAVLQS